MPKGREKIIVGILLILIVFGCRKNPIRSEFSPDKKYRVDFYYETRIPLVAYDVYVVVKKNTTNKNISKKTYIADVDVPEDICSNDKFRVYKWEKDKVLIYELGDIEEISFVKEKDKE